MARVFISYRRIDTKWAAGRLYDELAEVLGRDNIFFDVSNIEPGEDFVMRVGEIVGGCDILLVIIGPNWLSVRDKSGKRRLEDPQDLIRVEVATALRRGIRVIPILVDGAEMPDEHELPENLVPLARRNAHDISFARFHTDLESFIRVLERILAGPGSKAPTVQQAERAQTESRASGVVARELPFTIALETLGGVATPLIAKGARLPAEASEVFSTAAENQNSVDLKLSIGERAMAKDNVPVGTFQLHGIPLAPRGVPQITIKAIVDPTLILTVTAEDKATGRKEVLDAVDLTRLEIPAGAGEEGGEAPPRTTSTRDSPVNTSQMAEDARNAEAPKGFSELFAQFFGTSDSKASNRGERPGAQSHANDVSVDLDVSFEEAVLGAVRTVEAFGRRFKLKIPAGVDTGTRLRLARVVEAGAPGQQAGDLYLVLKVGHHARYTREGKDLYCTVSVSEVAARRGVALAVPPLGTRPPLSLEVPAHTPMGTRFRLRGQGVAAPSAPNAPGDLYVTLEEAIVD